MQRMGSGTTWLPDATPMRGSMVTLGSWSVMLHGVAFGVYDRQYSDRGGKAFSSVNWGMLMASHALAGGRLQLRTMLTAEPFTVNDGGYPLLLQSGETYHGQPLHDQQHPHDLVMELAASYDRAISNGLGVSLYVAPVGEPAIGPVAFPHRPSAMNDPMAPIGHHWQDATHISFGVVTAGLFTRSVRLEGSIFNATEPDENRTNFDYDHASLDSYSGRLTWNPSAQWSVSGSYAFLNHPEELHPDESEHRMGGSILYGRSDGPEAERSAAFIVGVNRHSGSDANAEPSYLVEANRDFATGHSLFGRAEYVWKRAEDLVVDVPNPRLDLFIPSEDELGIGAVGGGYAFDFDRSGSVRTGIGAEVTVNMLPSRLGPVYGTRAPIGLAVFIRFRPGRMAMTNSSMGGEGHHEMHDMPDMPGMHQEMH